MKIIENIIKLMEEKDKTPYRMEKDIGIKQTTFISWKKGSQPPADKIIKIAQYLEVTPNEIFGYETPIFLTENEKELLELFKRLPDREQIKFIGRLEDKVSQFTQGK